MNKNKTLIIAVILSLLLHILIIIFVKFVPDEDQKENQGSEPVEISVIPKSSLENEEIPKDIVPVEPEPLLDTEETTLEHDKAGGKNAGVENGAKEAEIKKEKAPVKEKINIPKAESKEKVVEDTSNQEMAANSINLYDNDAILDNILKEKKVQPKGEDTASYNKFEERYASYFFKFKQRVYQLWDYPAQSVARGETGVVKMSFSILKDGSIVNIRMIESSGYPALDREVMRVLKNMGKVPLPESYELHQLNIDEAFFIYTIGDDLYKYLR